MIHWKEDQLKQGKTITVKESGNSMSPTLKHQQMHVLTPVIWQECNLGDIVFCKVKGRYYTHLVLAKDNIKGLLIGNIRGRANGWTIQVFGKVTEIL